MNRVEVAIAGAGIAGLACAAELLRRGVTDIAVLEAGSRPGGAIESLHKGGFLIERGPITVRGTPELEALAQGCGVELIEGRRGAPALVLGGALLQIPPPLRELLRGRPLPLRRWAGLLAEPFRPNPPGPRSVADFVRQRLGARLADDFADLLTLGIYGAPASRVGFEAAFPGLAAQLKARGSLARMLVSRRRGPRPPRRSLVSTPGGLEALPRAIADSLGERLRLGCGLESVETRPEGFALGLCGGSALRARRLVLALPAQQIARLFASARDIARVARGYQRSAQTLVSFALADRELAERFTSFGFLVPPREALPLIGCLAPSAIFPGRAPAGCVLLSVFAAQGWVAASDAQLHEALAAPLQKLLQTSVKPELLDVARHAEGIWLYDRRQRARTQILRARLRAAGVEIAGAAFDGISVGDAAASGLRAARGLTPH